MSILTSIVSPRDAYQVALDRALDIVRTFYRASRSKTGDPACSAAVVAWKTHKATSETHKQLAKCRAMARTGGKAIALRGAGQEAKAQHLEHRLATGAPLGVGERKAKAKALIAEHAKKAAGPVDKTPSVSSGSEVEKPKVPGESKTMSSEHDAERARLNAALEESSAKLKELGLKSHGHLTSAKEMARESEDIGTLHRGNMLTTDQKRRQTALNRESQAAYQKHYDVQQESAKQQKKHDALVEQLRAHVAKKVAPVAKAEEPKAPEPHEVPAAPKPDVAAAKQTVKAAATPAAPATPTYDAAKAGAGKGFTKGKVTLNLGKEKREIDAQIKGNLAVHEAHDSSLGRGKKAYRVTHTGTGMAVGPAVSSMGRAKEIAQELHSRGIDVGAVHKGMHAKFGTPERMEAEGHVKFIKGLFAVGA